jgi:YD repeat-containing protein
VPNNGYADCLGPPALLYFATSFTDGCAAGQVVDLFELGCADNVGPYEDPPNNVCDGNPCSPATRGKLQTFLDYQAPGVRFSRTWRSRNAPQIAYGGADTAEEGRLPWGWTHSYASRVIVDGSGEPTALFRPNGALVEVFESSTDIYLATDSSGLQARGSGANDITVHLPDGSIEIYGYHFDTGCSAGLHRLDTLADSAGRETTVAYVSECSTDPVEIIGPFGHTLEIIYDEVNIGTMVDRVVEIVGADGESITFDYVATGNGLATGQLQFVTYQDLTVVEYHYDDAEQPAYLSGITDELDVRYATFTYNEFGYAIGTEHIDGYDEWTFTYDFDGTTTSTDANDVDTVYEFQTAAPERRIIGSITRDGDTRTMVNETSGQMRLLSETDENGVTTTNVYDTYHLQSLTEADGETEERLTEFDYLDDTSSRLTSIFTPSVYAAHTREVSITYNVDDLPETIEIMGYTPTGTTVSRSTGFEYNGDGQVTEIDGPRTDVSDVTTLTYYECTTGDECGQLESIENAEGHVTTFDLYDANGRLTQATDPNGVVTTYSYDLRGRLAGVLLPHPRGPRVRRRTTTTLQDSSRSSSCRTEQS